MKAGKTSISSRIISMLLAVVMVLGMVPFSAFAAEATSAEITNLQRIQEYAKKLFDKNFHLSTDLGETEEFSWSTEGKKGDKWRYYDGLMVDAYLAMGMAGDKGNILEFASNYFNTQLDENGIIRRFGNNNTLDQEVDSVAPARGLFDLLGTVADQDKYHTVLHDIYTALNTQFTKLPNVGGNVRHKPDSKTGWETWAFALDGTYMALPFLMEYANAIDSKKLVPPTGVTIDTTAIRNDVYTRLEWVATKMQDTEGVNENPATNLYFHGVKDTGTEFNKQFWTRGIGWYAVALTDVIELMPDSETTKKENLKGYLKRLFDSMIGYYDEAGKWQGYQDETTGLWYNVTNEGATLQKEVNGEVIKNELETSGSACMAYALMKAYNNSWVTDRKYGEAGLKAFNGIVNEKLKNKEDGTGTEIRDIYKSASVETTPADYLKNGYRTDEAKGVGAVLLAATQVEKTVFKLEKISALSATVPTGGMVKAPAGLTVDLNGTPDYSGVQASVVYSDGTIKNVSGSELTYSADLTTAGAKTVTASYQNVTVGTFEVTVVDPNAPAGTSYKLDKDGVDVGGDYLIVAQVGDAHYALQSLSGVVNKQNGVRLKVTPNADNSITLKSEDEPLAVWHIEKAATEGRYTVTNTVGENTTYLNLNSKGYIIHDSEGDAAIDIAWDKENGTYTFKKGGAKYLLVCTNENFIRADNADTYTGTMYLYKKATGGNTPVEPAKEIAFTLNTDSLDTIKLRQGQPFGIALATVTENGDEVDKNGYTLNLSCDNANLTVDGTTVTAGNTAGKTTATVTVKLMKGSEVAATKDVSLKVNVLSAPNVQIDTSNPNVGTAPTMKVGDDLQLSTVDMELAQGETITWSSSNDAIATVSQQGRVHGEKEGKATITATLNQPVQASQVSTLAETAPTATGTTVASIEVTVEETPATGNVTITTTGTPEAPAFTPTDPVEVTEPSTVYKKITKLADITTGQYVIVNASKTTDAMTNQCADNVSGRGGIATGSINSNDEWAFDLNQPVEASLWTFTDKGNNTFTIASNLGHHLRDNNDVVSTNDTVADSKIIEVEAGKYKINLEGKTDRYLMFNETEQKWSRATSESNATVVLLFKVSDSDTGTKVYAQLVSANGKGLAYTVGSSDDVLKAIKEQNNFVVKVYEDAEGKTLKGDPVPMSDSRITFDTNGLTMSTAGDYEVIVKLYGTPVGKIPVKVAEAASVQHKFNVTMPTMETVALDLNGTKTHTATVDPTKVVAKEASTDTTKPVNSCTFTWSSENADIATVDEHGVITAVAAGDTNIIGTLTDIKIDNLDGTAAITGPLTVKVPVKVTDTSTPGGGGTTGSNTYVLDIDGINEGEEYLIVACVDGKYYALKNVETEINGKKEGEKLDVERNGNSITIADANVAKWAEWTFGGKEGQVEIKNSSGTKPVYVDLASGGYGINSNYKKQSYVEAIANVQGGYYIRQAVDDPDMLYCDGQNFFRKSADCQLLLFKKQDLTTSIDVTSKLSMARFSERTLTPTVYHQGTKVSNPTLLWEYKDPDTGASVVDLTQGGTLTAKAPGTATIKVTLTHVNGTEVTGVDRVTAEITVTVEQVNMTISQETLTLYLDPPNLGDVGDKPHESKLTEKQLAVNITSGGSEWDELATVEWRCESVDTSEIVAELDANSAGLVKAKKTGKAKVTARLTEFNGKPLAEADQIVVTCNVTVETNRIKEIELNPNKIALPWGDSNETVEAQNARVSAALDKIVATISYYDGTSFQKTLESLKTYGERVTVTSDLDQVITAKVNKESDYTVTVHIKGPLNEAGYKRTVKVSFINPNMQDADGIVKYETDVKYKPAETIVSGQEYLIVAFPTDGNKTNGIVLSNDNATNKDIAKPHAVEATVGTIANGYVPITRPDGEPFSDGLFKWTFTEQNNKNWYITNFMHRLSVGNVENLLQARYDESSNTYRLYATKITGEDNAFYLTMEPWEEGKELTFVSLDNGVWKGVKKATPGPEQKVYLYAREAKAENQAVKLEVTPTEINTHKGMISQISTTILVNGQPATQWNLDWSSGNQDCVTVDNRGKVVAKKNTTELVTLTATLFMANGMEVIPNAGTNVTKTVTVKMSEATVEFTLHNNEVETRLGGRPDYSAVRLVVDCPEHEARTVDLNDPNVELDPLNAVDDPKAKGNKPLNLSKQGIYYVPVYYAQMDAGYVKVTVDPNPYLDLTATSSYPEYPAPGGVRIRKYGTGGQQFFNTGLAEVELQVAGVSSKSNVDVVLVVDVSNSMAWSMDWFGKGEPADFPADFKWPEQARDYDKIPKDANTKDKLALAMEYAQSFANTLLGNGESGNTLSFVTFAGNDLQHRADDGKNTNYADSVKTVFTSVTDPDLANASFGATQFKKKDVTDAKDKNGNSVPKVTCYLTIADTNGNPIADANGDLANRGNTNYDYAFGEAMYAVSQIKDKYQQDNGGKRYEESGREIHVVFMTDGAPSHYNGVWNTTNPQSKGYATLWGSEEKLRYDVVDNLNDKSGQWMEKIRWSNTLATELYSQITDMHVVGFDLTHGGYTGFSANAGELNEVLRGLVRNRVLNSVQADDTTALKNFFDNLAANLTYAATSAKVTDKLGEFFDLYTGAQGNDITKGVKPEIYVRAYDLNQDGERTGNFKDLEIIEFRGGGNTAESDARTDVTDILVKDAAGNPSKLEGKYLTYDFTEETFTWEIGNVEDKEYALIYWVYLKNSVVSNETNAKGEQVWAQPIHYKTNEKATLEYVDVNGQYANRLFRVPQVAWKAANVGVRFFLVNEDGEYINHAGQKFTAAANRTFLTESPYYTVGLGQVFTSETVQKIFNDAGLGSSYRPYNCADATFTVTHRKDPASTDPAGVAVNNYTGNLITWFDLTTKKPNEGDFLHAIVDIPVVLENYGTAESPLNPDVVVMDYGLPMPIDVTTNDKDRKENDVTTIKSEVLGFVRYDETKELRDYINTTKEGVTNFYVGNFGRFDIAKRTVGEKEIPEVRYTPRGIMTDVEKVFVAVKVWPETAQEPGSDFKVLLNPLTIVPANVVYYETDGDMATAFTSKGGWNPSPSGAAGKDTEQDPYTSGGIYGFDEHYKNDSTFSNGSAIWVAGVSIEDTNVSFSFKGTGFDIISKTGEQDGTIRVKVRDEHDVVKKDIMLINMGDNELYQVPVISVDDLEYGTYTVEIGVLQSIKISDTLTIGNQFYFDAVRIYGTIDAKNDTTPVLSSIEKTTTGESTTYTKVTRTVGEIYAADGEAGTVFEEIRDSLLTAGSFGESGVMFFEGMEGTVTPVDYAVQGPNNEVYLQNGNAIAFSFNIKEANSALHLGMKSMNVQSAGAQPVTASVTIIKDGIKYPNEPRQIEITSSTAQFYDLLEQTGFPAGTSGTVQVVISNAGGGILSLTDLKYQKGTGGDFAYSSEKLKDAVKIAGDDGVYVDTVAFAQNQKLTVRRGEQVTLTVTTGVNVTGLVVTNKLGGEVWSQAVDPADPETSTTEAGLTVKNWTVTICPTLLGEQTFTVYALRTEGEGTSATTKYNDAGLTTEGKITVTIY